jgi:hypothetical protein
MTEHTWVSVNVMVFNVTFNNISVISWRSVLLLEETGVPGVLSIFSLYYDIITLLLRQNK